MTIVRDPSDGFSAARGIPARKHFQLHSSTTPASHLTAANHHFLAFFFGSRLLHFCSTPTLSSHLTRCSSRQGPSSGVCFVRESIMFLATTSNSATGKQPWRLSSPQKARQRKRLRLVDKVVDVVSAALQRNGHAETTKAVQRWYTEMPREEEMLPKDKYTIFDRKEKKYRKGIHSEYWWW